MGGRLLLISVFILNCICVAPKHPKNYLNDYAWRDFEGLIPDDALKAGQDKLGNPLFIGQALYENKLIPGKIYENNPNIYFEWYGKEYSQQRNVKILCSTTPGRFEWIPTESDKIVLLTNKILIKGGYESPDYSTYLGRALIDGETVVGKIMCTAGGCLGLYTSSNGITRNIKKFEILTYNSDVKDFADLIDIRHNGAPHVQTF